MSYTIDSENLLLNYFATHHDERVGIRTLNRLRELIENDQTLRILYVDVTAPSLLQAATINDDTLKWEEDYFICTTPNDDISRKNLEPKSNWRIPESAKSKYLDLVRSFEDT